MSEEEWPQLLNAWPPQTIRTFSSDAKEAAVAADTKAATVARNHNKMRRAPFFLHFRPLEGKIWREGPSSVRQRSMGSQHLWTFFIY